MATQRFAIEFDRRTVGIAVRVPGGFVFYSSDDRFSELDGRIFGRARAIQSELAKFARRQKLAGPTLETSPALS